MTLIKGVFTMAANEETQVITKEKAAREVQRVVKDNAKFIAYCEVMIASIPNFKGIESYKNDYNKLDFEKLLRVTIDFGKYGFKQLHYRKGNKNNVLRKDIHDYVLISYDDGETEE